MTGSCLGMSATSLMFARNELTPEGFEAGVRYAASVSTRRRTFPDGSSDELGPPKPQEHRFRLCNYSEPVNLWARIHRHQAMQVTAEFLGSILSQMDGTGVAPMGAPGYDIAGNPMRTLNTLRSGNFRNHLLCFQNGADVIQSHCVVAYAALDDVGLDEETALNPVPAPGRSVLRVYDPNHPGNANRWFEINRTNNTYRYHWSWRPVVTNTPSGPVTNWVPIIWSGKGVYATLLSLFRGPGTMPGADLLARGLALLVFGEADAEYVDRDGRRWGYDASGTRVYDYPGGRAIAPFGNTDWPPTYGGRAAWFFPPEGRPPADIRVRVRPQPSASESPNRYQFYAGGAGVMASLQVDGVPHGQMDRLKVGEAAGALQSLRIEPQANRTSLQMALGMLATNRPGLVLNWENLAVNAGRALEVRALPDQTGADLVNQSGRALSVVLRVERADAGRQTNVTERFGPFAIPSGGVQRVELPDPALPRLRVSLDAEGDGVFEHRALTLPAGAPPPTMKLQAELIPTGLRLRWPVAAEPWGLETTDTLGLGAVWKPVDATPVAVDAATQAVTVSVAESARYFRLRR